MKKKYLILFALAVLTLTLLLSGCSGGQDELEGKYVVTFELNGGKLDIQSTEVNSRINYAYEPESYILDPSTYGNYKISRPGYVFTGWYKSAECNENDKWDFKNEKLLVEKLTLYAGWEKEIVFTFSVCYADDGKETVLGKYNVSEGDIFEDYRKYAEKRDNYTALGYYTDPECTTPWDFDTKHPGGDKDTDVKIYVDYLEGEWILVDSYSKLTSAVGKGNVYLTSDIDCGGENLYFRDTFKYVFEGNGHTISNFKVEKQGKLKPSGAIFSELGDGACVQNVNFTNATFDFLDIDSTREVKVAALALSAGKGTVTNVSVSGKIVTNYEGEFPRLNEAIYDEATEMTLSEFTANIVVEKQ